MENSSSLKWVILTIFKSDAIAAGTLVCAMASTMVVTVSSLTDAINTLLSSRPVLLSLELMISIRNELSSEEAKSRSPPTPGVATPSVLTLMTRSGLVSCSLMTGTVRLLVICPEITAPPEENVVRKSTGVELSPEIVSFPLTNSDGPPASTSMPISPFSTL